MTFLLALLVLVLCVQHIQSAFVVDPTDELFAIVGGNVCAENLPYGPVAITTAGTVDGKYEYFLSTNTPNKNVVHRKWTQVVTSDGETELFRIYWTFSLPGTLSEIFFQYSNEGRDVSWRVVEANTNQEHVYKGRWLFAADEGMASTTFDINYVARSFSAGRFLWGAFNGTYNYYDTELFTLTKGDFWGIGNYVADGDISCSWVRQGTQATQFPGTKVYMYMSGVVTPNQPSATPTRAPTAGPVKTIALNAPSNMQLFAVIGGASCAENLPFGPQAITKTDSADGQNEYFLSTLVGQVGHDEWLQVVTDGDTELFRIYWTFYLMKSIAERIDYAVNRWESVDYRVVDASTGQEHLYQGNWRFSSRANITVSTFGASTSATSAGSLSVRDGVWGASSGEIDGGSRNGLMNAHSFWGMGNFYGVDNVECSKVYKNGVVVSNAKHAKTYMYSAAPAPTMRPTFSSADAVRMWPYLVFKGITFAAYEANQAAVERVLALALASAVGVNPEDVHNFQIYRSGSSSSGTFVETALAVHCKIVVEFSRGYTYNKLADVFYKSVKKGQLLSLVHSFAVQENVPELSSVIMSHATVQNDGIHEPQPSSGKKEAVLTVPMIIGIAIGGFALLLSFACCLARCAPLFALYHCLCPCNKSVEPQDAVQAPRSSQAIQNDEEAVQENPTKLDVSAPPLPLEISTSAPPQKYDVFKTANKTEDFAAPVYGEKSKPGPPQKFDVFKSTTPARASGAGAAADGDINSFFYGASASNNTTSTTSSNNSYHGLFGRSAAPRAEPSVPVPAVAVPVSGDGGGGNGYAEVAIVEAYEGEV